MAWAIFHLNMKSIIFPWERNNNIVIVIRKKYFMDEVFPYFSVVCKVNNEKPDITAIPLLEWKTEREQTILYK